MLFFLIFLVLSLNTTVFYASDLQGLPFPYHLSLQYSCKTIRYLPEETFTVLHPGQQVLVGPLLPCQLVLFYFNNIVIVGHLDYNVSFLYLLNRVKRIMKKNYDSRIEEQKGDEENQPLSFDSSTINQVQLFCQLKKVVVFTNKSASYYHQFYSEKQKKWTSWWELYNYRSQEKVVEEIVEAIKSYFLINNTIIKASIGLWQLDQNAKYPLASLYLVVRNSARYNFCFINTICPVSVMRYYNTLGSKNNGEHKCNINDRVDDIMMQRSNIRSNLDYPKDLYRDGKQIPLEVGQETFFSFNKNDGQSS